MRAVRVLLQLMALLVGWVIHLIGCALILWVVAITASGEGCVRLHTKFGGYESSGCAASIASGK